MASSLARELNDHCRSPMISATSFGEIFKVNLPHMGCNPTTFTADIKGIRENNLSLANLE
jgi:hypothetical protein